MPCTVNTKFKGPEVGQCISARLRNTKSLERKERIRSKESADHAIMHSLLVKNLTFTQSERISHWKISSRVIT